MTMIEDLKQPSRATEEFRKMPSSEREVALFALLGDLYAAQFGVTAAGSACYRALEYGKGFEQE